MKKETTSDIFRQGDLVVNNDPIDKLNFLIPPGMIFEVDSTVSLHHKGNVQQKLTLIGEPPNGHVRVSGITADRFSLIMAKKDRVIFD